MRHNALLHATAVALARPQACPLPEPAPPDRSQILQRRRRIWQGAFFALFLVAPALDWLRFDLHEAQLWLLGQRWSLGIDALRTGHSSATETALSIVLRGMLPALLLVTVVLAVAYRYGRLYCGWLCPHFSSVEALNSLLHRAIGKFSLWDSQATPRQGVTPNRRWWPVFMLSCVTLGFVWAITLVTYLLPPREIWFNLVHARLTPNQARFLFIAWGLFTAEFALARHLFCRYACAAGLFQSLAWMANPRGLVVSFDRQRARDCKTCGQETGSAQRQPQAAPRERSRAACENDCPIRLQPRQAKRLMFACVQCGRCLQACAQTQHAQSRQPLLEWTVGLAALRETLRQKS